MPHYKTNRKIMANVIFEIGTDPVKYIESYNSSYEVTTTTDIEQAQEFTAQEADALIDILGVDFWGSRRKRPK